MPYRHQTAFVCVYAPSGLLRLSFLAPGDSPPLSDEDLYLFPFFAYVKIMFAHTSYPACAIEVQHSNETCFTIGGPAARQFPPANKLRIDWSNIVTHTTWETPC